MNRAGRIALRTLGVLSIPSGVIGVYDLEYLAEGFSPLGRRVSPGAYNLQFAEVDGLVAAARLVLKGTGEARTWRPACRTDGGGNRVEVHVRALSVFDAAAAMKLEKRDLERRSREGDKQSAHPGNGRLLALDGKSDQAPDCAIFARKIGQALFDAI